jgi:HJR/Mrr/RecB family endonuclease
MLVELPAKRPLTQLNHEIEAAEAEAARLESERRLIAADVRRASRRLQYLLLAKRLRAPAKSLELWPIAVLLVGPLACGIAALVLVNLLTSSYPVAFFAFLLGIVAGVGLFASLIYHPADTLLPAAFTEAESAAKLANARLGEKLARISDVKQHLQRLIDERRDQIASGKLQRAALLQRNWKAMRDAEWEDFIVEVLRTHGAKVDRTNRPGSEDANLIADFGSRRVAVLTTLGESGAVDSASIRNAIAAKERRHCDAAAAIINRRFTGAAQDFAQRNGCAAIGAGEFPDFVLGKIQI